MLAHESEYSTLDAKALLVKYSSVRGLCRPGFHLLFGLSHDVLKLLDSGSFGRHVNLARDVL